MTRRWLVALMSAAILIGLLPAAAAGAAPPLPVSMAATGDSISQAASSGGSLGADYPANSWSTGSNTMVNSHYLRVLADNPAIGGHNTNASVSGARMADLNGQMSGIVSSQPEYVTVLMGGNDLCTDTVAAMTSVADFRVQFAAAMATITSGSPNTHVYVLSIPNVYQLWSLFKGSFWARFIWSTADICQSLLDNPTSTQTSDVQRRATVAQRNVDFNAQLAQVCATYAACRFDNGAVYNTSFSKSDVAGDYFHPSISGQAKLAAVSWAAGYWPDGAPTDEPPVAAFTSSCTDLTCMFDAGTSTDDNGVVSYGWTFGDGTSGSGQTASHTYAVGGTYAIELAVTDSIGQTATATASVAATMPGSAGSVHVASLSGSSSARRGGWTATVTVGVKDGDGNPIGGAVVAGSWSTGGTAGCTTSASGSCTFDAPMNKKTGSAAYTVSDVAAAPLTYDASHNIANVVTVARP